MVKVDSVKKNTGSTIETRNISQYAVGQTILGAKRQNPYKLQNIKSAHQTVYGTSGSSIIPTHKYVEFNPTEDYHMKWLDSMEVDYNDFDLLREVIHYGEYYQDYAIVNHPTLYAVIENNFNLGICPVPYQLLDLLYLNENDPLLLLESFIATGNESYINEDVFKGGLSASKINEYDINTTSALDLPPRPEEDCPPGYEWKLVFEVSEPSIDVPAGTRVYKWVCMPINDPPNNQNDNGCGCSINSNKRKPGGCVQVEDIELGMVGVEDVKVRVWNGWLTFKSDQTDENGCWQINTKMGGKVFVKIFFENNRCRIRGVAGNWKATWEWITTVYDDVGVFEGGVYNDIHVEFFFNPDNNSQGHRYWSAATINNGLHEFHDYAAQDGIDAPPNNLDILMARNAGWGYALMNGQYLFSGNPTAIASSFFGDPIGDLIASISNLSLIVLYLPEVCIGTDFDNSDRLKSLIYHEIAHTSHYSQVGPIYWDKLVQAEIYAAINGITLQDGLGNGWGDGTEPDAGRVQICESWAEHIGDIYTDRTYGLDHSLTNSINAFDIAFWRWLNLLERDQFDALHVPVALHFDLIDDNANPLFGSQENPNVRDILGAAVSGYSNQVLFNTLDNSITSPIEYREALKFVKPTGIFNNMIDSLFFDYGF